MVALATHGDTTVEEAKLLELGAAVSDPER
jgi:hypothetical protein